MSLENKSELNPNEQMSIEYTFRTKPFKHQYICFKENLEKTTYAYFMEMGTGKSKVLIDTVGYLYDKDYINAVLIVAPKSVYRNWIEQFDLHCAYNYAIAYYDSYMTKKRERELKAFDLVKDKLKILLVNVEAFSSDNGLRVAFPFIRNHKTLMAVDESTTIKSGNAKRTRNIIQIGKYAKYRRILTGQPAPHSPLDIYTQCYFLDYRLLNFQSYFAFRSRYAIMDQMVFGHRRFMKVSGFQRLDELSKKLETFSFRVKKEDCLDLPPKIYVTRDVELTPRQRQMYEQMKKLAVIELERADLVTAPMIMTRIGKLHQIICGHIKSDTGVVTRIENRRVAEVLSILDEIQGKVIIWGNYQEDIKMLVETIAKEYSNDSVAAYYGPVKQDDREEIRAKFQDPTSKLRFFVGTPATGRFGVNLTLASTVIYYSNSDNLEYRSQSEERAHRIGSEMHEKITYIDLVCRGTQDEKILNNLKSKQSLSDLVMDKIKNGTWRELFKENEGTD